jgi:putative permease
VSEADAGLEQRLESALDQLAPLGSRARLVVQGGIVAWGLLGVGALALVVARMVGRVGLVFPPLVVAGIEVALLEPIASWLGRRGLSRRWSVAVAFGLLVAAMLVLFVVVVPALVRQFDDLVASSPLLAGKGESLAERLSHSSNGLIRVMGTALSGWIAGHAGTAPRLLRELSSVLLRLAQAGFVILAGSVLGFLFLASREPLVRGAVALVPPSRRARMQPVVEQVRGVLVGFLRSRVIVSSVVGTLATLGLWALHVPFWLVLGFLVGVANLIPVLGTPIGFIPVAAVTLLTRGPAALIPVTIMLALAHAVDGYLLSPILLKETIDVHPVVALLAAIVGAEVLGFWGILAAIPAAALIQLAMAGTLRRWRDRAAAT